MGTVTGIDADDVLNVRAEASYDAEFIGELLNGAQVEILDTVTDDEDNTWYKINTGNKEGFVSADYVVNNSEIKNLDKSSSVTEESEEDDETEDGSDDETDGSDDEDYE